MAAAANGPGAQAPGPLICFVVLAVTVAATTASGATPAGASAAGATATGRPTCAERSNRSTDGRAARAANSHVAMPAVPAMPSCPTAPTEAATPGVTAPIEARAAPAIVVPAVISSAEEELSLFDITGNGGRREAVDRQGVGLANRAHHGEGKRGCGGVDPMSHEGVSVLLCPMSGFNAEPCCSIQSKFQAV